MDFKRAIIQLRSVMDGEETFNEYEGEYTRRDNCHKVVYTDRSGNVITKVEIEADEKQIMLRRKGGITADMLFCPGSATHTDYKALYLNSRFYVHTLKYRLEETENDVDIFISYTLYDESGELKIPGTQEIKIEFF